MSEGDATLRSVRPALKAGLRPVWRDRETVQIGVDPRRAVALTGMGGAAVVIGLLDGSRDRDQVIASAREQGVPAPVTEQILTLLAAGGVLDDFPAAALAALSQEQRLRLRTELATAALARGCSDAGAAVLARRDAARVQIYGPGRLAATLADILTTSGVGHVTTCDDVRLPAPATATTDSRGAAQAEATRTAAPGATDAAGSTAADPACPEEAGTADSGPAGAARTREAGTADSGPAGAAGARAAGTADSRMSGTAGTEAGGGWRQRGRPVLPDLVVLVGYQQPELAGWLMRAGVPHLSASAEEAIGIVGPMVRPGRTSCLRCLHLTRSDLDPAWPLILAQLVGQPASLPACDAALTAAVAAQAAVQALAYVDRDPAHTPAENGTLELELPGWQWRRRTWPPHPACPCTHPR